MINCSRLHQNMEAIWLHFFSTNRIQGRSPLCQTVILWLDKTRLLQCNLSDFCSFHHNTTWFLISFIKADLLLDPNAGSELDVRFLFLFLCCHSNKGQSWERGIMLGPLAYGFMTSEKKCVFFLSHKGIGNSELA